MKKLCLSAVVLGVAAGARGDFYEVFDTFGPQLTDFSDSVTLPKFDPNFGNLISVTYTLEATLDGSVTVDSENPAATSVTFTIAGNLKVRDGATTLLDVSPSTSNGAALTADTDAGPDFIGSDSAAFGAVLPANAGATTSNPADLSDFTATILGETFTWNVDAKGLSGVLGSGNQASLVNQSAGGIVKVRYEYSTQVVPEASTYVSGFGLLGLVALAGRRLVRR